MKRHLMLPIAFILLLQAATWARQPNVILIMTDDQANGFWDLEVARGGVYRISLRRWPEEADVAIGAIVEQGDLDSAKIDVNARLYQMPSQAIHATKARLKIGGFDETRPIKPTDKAITFHVELDAGRMNLQTWLTDDEGESWGAYFVYVERLKPENRPKAENCKTEGQRRNWQVGSSFLQSTVYSLQPQEANNLRKRI